MSNRIIHFEIPSDNPEQIKKFYETVFGWKIDRWGNEDYWLITTGDNSKQGINGGLMKKKHPEQPMVNTINVPSVDEWCKKIAASGGQVVVPKTAIPTVGWLAYFKDVDGNIFGIMEDDKNAK